ncbi:MAG: hypothetical protein QXV61_00230 [Archaeoglobaceae archaeon]
MQQRSRWDSYGVTPPSGAAKYEAGKQPIAEYDNWFNKAVVDDIADLNTELTQHKTASVLDHPNGSVTTAKIADGAITTAKIANSAVTDVKIADGAVTNAKIANNAVTTAKIADGNITTAKIADGAVTDAKISGRLSLSKLPTSSTANRVLAVRTANADPVYDTIKYSDIVIDSFPFRFTNTIYHASAMRGIFLPYIFTDMLLWSQPNVEKYINGEWVSVSNSDYLKLFSGAKAYSCSVIIPNGSNEYLRFTFDLVEPYHCGYFLALFAHVSWGNGIKITLEFSDDGTNWTTVLNDYDIKPINSDPTGGVYCVTCGSTNEFHKRYMRLTLKWVWNSTNAIVLYRISLLSYGSITYDPRRILPFGWDTDGFLLPRFNLSYFGFATHLMPKTDNTYDIGSDTLRWRRIRAVTVSTGDIELANDWKITELEDGVVIKNPNGEEIFKITEGGLWFKGNKIA